MALTLVEDVREKLNTDRFGQQWRGYESVGSTNSVAAEWAREGAPEGSVVVTEYQSAGRGRQGRTWTAKKGQNLMFSVVLRSKLPAERLGLITIGAGVGVADAIDAFVSPHRAELKWPNDVILEGRKTCGMLLESSISAPSGPEETVVVLGVGMNVNQTSFPEDLSDRATSLRLTVGRAMPRAALFARVLKHLEERYMEVERGDIEPIRSAFHDRLRTLNETSTLRISDVGSSISGVVRGITETGALRIETSNGIEILHAGDVTSRTEEEN